MFKPEVLRDLSLSEKIQGLLDTALVNDRKAKYAAGRGSGVGDVAKKRIGSGYIGLECARQLAYKYHKTPEEEREGPVGRGELQRHAEAGFWTEEKTAQWMELAGFQIRTTKVNGGQFGFLACKDDAGQARMAGEVDGIIRGGPVELPYPVIWESKKATHKKFTEFQKKGVKAADIKYYGQLQNNMLYLEVHYTLFSMLNLDNMKYYWELISFDPKYAQKLQDKAVKVFQSQSPEEIPRITDNPSDFACKFCPYWSTCFDSTLKPKKQPEAKIPFWLQKQK